MAADGKRRTASGRALSDYDVRSGDRTYAVTVHEAGEEFDVTVNGRMHHVQLIPWVGPTHFRLLIDGSPAEVVLMRAPGEVRVTIGCDQHRLRVAPLIPIQRRGTGGDLSAAEVLIEAPMPGLIVSVQAAVGSTVSQGAAVVVMEAMKMQMEIRAPSAGRIRSIRVQAGQEVSKGQVLVELAAETTA